MQQGTLYFASEYTIVRVFSLNMYVYLWFLVGEFLVLLIEESSFTLTTLGKDFGAQPEDTQHTLETKERERYFKEYLRLPRIPNTTTTRALEGICAPKYQ